MQLNFMYLRVWRLTPGVVIRCEDFVKNIICLDNLRRALDSCVTNTLRVFIHGLVWFYSLSLFFFLFLFVSPRDRWIKMNCKRLTKRLLIDRRKEPNAFRGWRMMKEEKSLWKKLLLSWHCFEFDDELARSASSTWYKESLFSIILLLSSLSIFYSTFCEFAVAVFLSFLNIVFSLSLAF